MRQIRQTLRLHFEAGLSYAEVSPAIPMAKATVGNISPPPSAAQLPQSHLALPGQ